MKIVDALLILLTMAIWGVSFSVVKVGLEELPPILFIALRFLIVAIPAILIIPFPKTSVWNVVSVGILIGIIKFGLLFVAMEYDAGAGVSSLILQAQVFFTILLSYFLYKENIFLSQLIGIIIAAFGFGFFFMSKSGSISLLGLILVTSAALAWAASNLIMKQLEGVNFFHFMVWMSVIPPIPLLLLSFIFETNTPLVLLISVSLKAWLSVAYMGYLSTLLAYALWGVLLKRYAAATITPFALLIPIIGVLTASIWLKERLSLFELTGSLLVIAGLAFCFFGETIFKILRIRNNTHAE